MSNIKKQTGDKKTSTFHNIAREAFCSELIYPKQAEYIAQKSGCDFGCDFCPFLSTFVHSYKQQRPPKLEAFVLKIFNLALYARRDSNPQPLAPEANALMGLHDELRCCP